MSFDYEAATLRNSLNMAFLGVVYARHQPAGSELQKRYTCWGLKQMR